MAKSHAMGAPQNPLLEFVEVFSRFEYALKSTSVLSSLTEMSSPGRSAPILMPFKTSAFLDVVDYLLTQFPKKQILDGKKLGWRVPLPTLMCPARSRRC